MATILRQQDSLQLTECSGRQPGGAESMYTIKNDAIWAPVAKYFAELPTVRSRLAYDKYMSARKATIDLLMQLAPGIKGC